MAGHQLRLCLGMLRSCNPKDSLQQFTLADRLGEVGFKPQFTATCRLAALSRGSLHDDRRVCKLRIFTDLFSELESAHSRHAGIGQHQPERRVNFSSLPQYLQRSSAVCCKRWLHAPACKQTAQITAIRQVVADNQDPHALQRDLFQSPLSAADHGNAETCGEVENASLSQYTFQPDAAAHHFHELTGNG